MNTHLRITSTELERIHRDLDRPHPFALERVGFLLCGAANLSSGGTLLVAQTWMAVEDSHYIDDPTAGATIGPAAFRRVMEGAYNKPTTILHVHRHEHRGAPAFSPTDMRSMNQFVPGLFNACRSHPHGAVVMSQDAAYGVIWASRSAAPTPIRKIEIVGQPLRVWRSA